MIGLTSLLAAIERIRATAPTYQTRGTGVDGTCDCVGLLMGAMVLCGYRRYDMHSSNYFARYQMADAGEIGSPDDCYIGMVVYKRTASTANLNARYQPGGRYYTGDLYDYYHVGIVTGVQPLRITHCTFGGGVDGITVDYKLGDWRWGGRLKGVDYTQTIGGITMATAALYDARVTTSGGILNIRALPMMTGKDMGDIPNGDLVQVLDETNATWAKVYWQGLEGFVKREYIKRIDGGAVVEDAGGDGSGGYDVVFHFSNLAAAKAFAANLATVPTIREA